MIFVTAARSGNDEDIVSRREPLALIAAENMLAQYDVDRARVFVGGMSGGSRMALRLALAYPDLFRGALSQFRQRRHRHDLVEPLPPAPLFRQFQTGIAACSTSPAITMPPIWKAKPAAGAPCTTGVFPTRAVSAWPLRAMRWRRLGAEACAGLLLAPDHPDPAALADCRAQIEAEVAGKLDQVEKLIAGGRRDDARSLLRDIDARFGGMAAPKSSDLYAALGELPP